MTIAQALQSSSVKLQPQTNKKSERGLGLFEAEILLAHILKQDRVWIIAHPEYKLTPAQHKKFSSLVTRRKHHEPIAYLTGEKYFYGRAFKVNSNVLIPRPETELIVDLILRSTQHADRRTYFWDVGTGSGALAVTLAKEFPQVSILGSDISSQALAVARSNARKHKTQNTRLIRASLLDSKIEKYLRTASQTCPRLIIVANLPYLPESDKKVLDADVVKFEPHQALFTGREGLELIIRFLDQIAFKKTHLGFKKISLYFEFDPPQAKDLKKLSRTLFPESEIQIHRDLARRNRILEITIVIPA